VIIWQTNIHFHNERDSGRNINEKDESAQSITKMKGSVMRYMPHTHAACAPSARRPRLGLRHYLVLWKQRRQLARMEAWQRHDLGLSAGDIEDEVNRAPWDAPDTWRQ
jgi:uncharacterized protein YjiS (DUF1127 family)